MLKHLKAQPEENNIFCFQLVDVKVIDVLPSVVQYSHKNEITGDDFVSDMLDAKPTYLHNSVVVLIGCTEKGNSICVKVDDFKPFLYYKKNGDSEAVIKARIANQIDMKNSENLTIKVVKCKHLYGWEPNTMEYPTDRKEHEYVQVFFPTVRDMKKALYQKNSNFMPHEGQITVETKFMDINDIVPSGWIEVKGFKCDRSESISHCAVELETSMRHLKAVDKDEIAPLLIAAIDIESFSSTGGFPDASLPADKCFMIGAVFWRVGMTKEEAVKYCYVVGECSDVPDGTILRFATEKEMLSQFRVDLCTECDADIIATYNGFGFDCEYMWTRANLLNCDDFFYMDRISSNKTRGEKKELSSSALGSNELFVWNMMGRCNLDIFHWVKAREKLESYKLDSVCEHFLGEHKLDMDYKELFRMAQGTPEELGQVASYCIQDCALLIGLILRLQILSANVEMSRVCFTPMEALVTRGQQFKVMNQLVHYGHRQGRRSDGNGGYVLNTPYKYSGDKDDTYEGATVIDAKASYYTTPIATLDFMSLYPSIMMANNFCYSTIVMDPKYMNIPGVEYVTIKVSEKKIYTWAKGMQGLLPIMLENLLATRKKAKKAKANAKTPEEKAVMDARQLALKVSANSMYGFTGAVKMGKMHCLGIADSTTFRARQMLHQTQEWVKQLYPCDVVYGDTDSIMVKFEGAETVEQSFAMGDDASEKITRMFSDFYQTDKIILEMEKVYFPYLLMRKKRYAGLMYEKNKHDKIEVSYLDAKGIELVRRDNCPVAKRIQSAVLDALMYKIDRQLACDAVNTHMTDIVDNKIPLMDYKMSKSRRKDYVNEDLPHLAVVRKMKARNPGSEPQIGDRVPYILIETMNLKAKTFEKAEDPKFIVENNLKVDRLYYVEHQIVKPICSLLDLVVDKPENLFVDHLRKLRRQREGQSNIFGFLQKAEPEDKKFVAIKPISSASKNDGAVNIITPNEIQTNEEQTNEEQTNEVQTNEVHQNTPDPNPLEDLMMQIPVKRVGPFKAAGKSKSKKTKL